MDPRDNLILRALPEAELARLVADMHEVPLVLGDIVYEQDQPVGDVYFPLSGAVSVLVLMEDGSMMEPGIIGREGVLGFPFGIGDDLSRWRSLVQVPGEALVMPRARLRDHLRGPGNLAPLLTHYAGLLVTLIAQSAACSQFHELRQRCGRWLLLSHDRASGDEFELTHDLLAAMMGTHRPSVTIALGELRDAGLIATARGRIRILDREGLERDACECYGRVQLKFDESVEVIERYSTGGGHRYEHDQQSDGPPDD